MKELFKTNWDAADIILVPICVIIDYLGKLLAYSISIPWWFDSVGTIIASSLGGPVIGMITGIMHNCTYGLSTGIVSSMMYSLTSMGIALVVGTMVRKGYTESYLKLMLIILNTIIVSVLISSSINIILFNGAVGNVWGDGFIKAAIESGLDYRIASVLGELLIDVPDKLLCMLLAYVIMIILPSRARLLYNFERIKIKKNIDKL